MRSDIVIAFQMMLIANGSKPIEKFPLSEIAQELLDYVNSPEYTLLIIKEYEKIHK